MAEHDSGEQVKLPSTETELRAAKAAAQFSILRALSLDTLPNLIAPHKGFKEMREDKIEGGLTAEESLTQLLAGLETLREITKQATELTRSGYPLRERSIGNTQVADLKTGYQTELDALKQNDQ